MARFDRQIATALRLIQKNGQLVQWRQLQRTDDPADPAAVIEGPPVDHNVYICFLPVDKDTKEFIAYLRGTNEIKIGSVIGLMGNVPFTPDGSDYVIRDGKSLEIFNIDLLSPNGQKVLYTVEFKG
ncbi:head-tail joining protein [Xanthomonas phage Pfeifenkraut]|uniref:Head-tail joining protein n=1 Tax=Xanthomonas phage Pfeifenkraut TaxID=2939132 RepID=A0A9E7E132_9CAUD|nr:head-tail joining protein [Xanthomonas phage Pfeifenkraut]URA06920.1 head-tail joining protein [Xanthomonas phage Pfeifenkraut]